AERRTSAGGVTGTTYRLLPTVSRPGTRRTVSRARRPTSADGTGPQTVATPARTITLRLSGASTGSAASARPAASVGCRSRASSRSGPAVDGCLSAAWAAASIVKPNTTPTQADRPRRAPPDGARRPIQQQGPAVIRLSETPRTGRDTRLISFYCDGSP